ncbi:hypothetical protein PPL_05603 [Heterostelium album PN500]|uniref:Complex 1 LYR protein domain-containing protein n=1 Tax=Heterostelium pallidum (strain ATCC 26659 / Pp 5 / PN500) TaxID=670386 RepID=D3BAM5_HETP5|nr:hypothetical protein PPL_05603 [Heterostelium album PN500]EFA81612.1 hypothetical protein PPL_05603 [Heterostelium album PN500]|eukprot:XP_020433729.1 hypothetical protein PPL_05603 [Heterostelium album PN500]
MSVVNPKSIALYRTIVRAINTKLPKQAQNYYWAFTREHFAGHKGETDPRDIDLLIEKGYNNLDWIIKKYNATEDAEPYQKKK